MLLLLPLLSRSLFDCSPVTLESDRHTRISRESLDCLLISDSRFIDQLADGTSGGAVHIESTVIHVTIDSSTFQFCFSSRSNDDGGYGGGIWSNSERTSITRCCGSNCSSSWYGKFAFLGGDTYAVGDRSAFDCTVFQCAIDNIGDRSYGDEYAMGGAFAGNPKPPGGIRVSRMNFTACESPFGSAIRAYAEDGFTISFIVIAGCRGSTGIYGSHGSVDLANAICFGNNFSVAVAFSYDVNFHVILSKFFRNEGPVFGRGEFANLEFRSCEFDSNEASDGSVVFESVVWLATFTFETVDVDVKPLCIVGWDDRLSEELTGIGALVTATGESGGGKTGTESWVIAVAVIVPVLAVAAGAIGIVIWRRRDLYTFTEETVAEDENLKPMFERRIADEVECENPLIVTEEPSLGFEPTTDADE